MMRPPYFGLVLVVLLALFTTHASARHLKLQIQDGRVHLDAEDVTIADILAEWKRIGGTQIDNVEVLSTDRVNLSLVDVPEKFALQTILQTTQGYAAMPRRTGSSGGSLYERIMLFRGTVDAALLPPPPPPPAPQAVPDPVIDPDLPPTIEELLKQVSDSATMGQDEPAKPDAQAPPQAVAGR